jgi:hypothetical protein
LQAVMKIVANVRGTGENIFQVEIFVIRTCNIAHTRDAQHLAYSLS